MEQLYHVTCTNTDSATYIITKVLPDDNIIWRSQSDDIGNDLSFNIFECKRLIELAEQEVSLSTFDIEYTYKIIPANID